jgi:hypothetical protein
VISHRSKQEEEEEEEELDGFFFCGRRLHEEEEKATGKYSTFSVGTRASQELNEPETQQRLVLCTKLPFK